MSRQRRRDELEARARAVGERHHGRGDAGQVGVREADHQVMRQRGQRVDERLGIVARRGESELVHRRDELAPQHRDLAGRRGQRGAGPHARVDRQRSNAALFDQRDDEQVERHPAVDFRQAVGLDDQRARRVVGVEPGEGAGVAVFGQELARALAADAERVRGTARALAGDMAEQREHPAAEPAQQRGAFGIADRPGVGFDPLGHRRPIGDRRAHVAQGHLERLLERAAILRIDPHGLEIDHRFALLARGGQCDQPVARSFDRYDRVDQQVDLQALRGESRGDRIDQERHVVVDHGDAHDASARRATQQDRRFARGANKGGFEQEFGGFGQPFSG